MELIVPDAFLNFIMLEKYNVILASGSPRRSQLLQSLDVNFSVMTLPGLDESYPVELQGGDIVEFLANKKADAYKLDERQLLITADTIVWHNNTAMGKPKNVDDAAEMIMSFSGNTHSVFTGVCVRTASRRYSFVEKTDVKFSSVDRDDVLYYVNKYRPLDKAGAYGIQEWIGNACIEGINGDFYNVMGLPTHRLYSVLKMVDKSW